VISQELREFAQTPDKFTMLPANVVRYVDDRVCVIQGPTWAGVTAVRVGPGEVAALRDEVRDRVPAEKPIVWWIDPDAQPADLEERLRAIGLREPADRGYLLHALACVDAPAPAPDDVVVRQVESLDDWLGAMEVMWEAFDTPPGRREEQRPHLEDDYEAARAAGVPATFLAEVDGRLAGLARSVYSDRGVFLIAGGVVEWARGRGVYRALVRARWDDAVARGTPALVTEALADTSYPILKRLGFVDIATIRRLEDVR
jgi:hypothetical protein